jgi:hypothetical protein
MGSYGSVGSAAPYIQAGSEGAISASVGGSMKYIIKRNEDDDENGGGVYYYNGNRIDNRPYRPNNYYYK